MSYEECSDEELMKMFQLSAADNINEPNEAELYFKELFRRYYSSAYSFCLHYGLRHNDALETIQEAFINIFRYSSSYQAGRTFKPWFFKILYNNVNHKFRELKNFLHEDSDEQAESLGKESSEIKLLHDREVLNTIIYRLPKHLKECLLLYIYQEMDFNSIGKTIGISPRLARNRVDEAVRELKRLAGENDV